MSVLKVNQIQTANGVIMANLNSSGANVGIQLASTLAPAFSAVSSGTQSITSSTYTKVQFATENFDTNSNFDSTTNHRFTPTVAGYYQVNATLDCEGAGSQNIFVGMIYKNGSENAPGIRFLDIRVSSTLIRTTGSSLIYMNGTTDYLEVYVWINGTSPTVIGNFSGFLARSA